MADYNSMNREIKKQRLRENIIRSEDNTKAGGRRAGWQEEDQEELIGKVKRARRKKRLLLLLCVCVLAGGAFGWFQYQKYHHYTDYTVSWEKPIQQGSIVGYAIFGDNMLKYSNDGAAYLDSRGKTVWNEPFEMKDPVVAVNGDYAAIADRGGNTIYICTPGGRQGIAATILPITRVTISAQGVTAAIVEDTTSSFIVFYKQDGSSMKISIKSALTGDGYPMAASLSADGTQLLCAFAYRDGGEIKSRAVFYNFSSIGQNMPDRMAGAFADDPFAGSMIGQVQFLKEPYSFAASDNSLTFFSSQNLASPKVVKHIEIEEAIHSLVYSKDYAGVIVKEESGSNDYRLDLYQANGDKIFSKAFTYPYKYADIDGDKVLLYNEDSCSIYNLAGVEIFRGTFDFPVSGIRSGKLPGTYLIMGPDVIKEIKLQG